jgi:hypothetical protein
MTMKREIVIGIVLLAVAIVFFLFPVNNSYASEQRQSIVQCGRNEDCVIKEYVHEMCGEWSGCFNHREEPQDDIDYKWILGTKMVCDSPPSGCECINQTCRMK